jgi:aerobic carbon-monoxide dehydrogenase medium subunit
MRIRPFDFRKAHSLSDAINQLDQIGPNAQVIAGGTDLVLNLKKKKALPKAIISLHSLRNLDYVQEKNGVIHIGALAKHADLAANPILQEKLSILCQAVGLIGSWQIRNVGTIGGNICNASPAADSAPPLLTLDAEVVIATPQGEKAIPISSFFLGPGKTVMNPNEILKEIYIKTPVNRSVGCYLKLRRRKAVDISSAGVAFQAELDSSGQKLAHVKIALGGVAPTPMRVPEAENCLCGLSLDEAIQKIPMCAEAATNAAKPIDDLRATAEYRRTIVNVFIHRSAQQVLTTLKNHGGKQ